MKVHEMSLIEMTPKEQRKILDEILLSNNVDWLLEELNKKGDLYLLFPEVYAIVGFGGKKSGHKDLWFHTKLVVKQAEPSPIIRWAALFHDIGKPRSFVKHKGKISFHQHEAKSARLFQKIAKRTKLWTDEEVEKIHFLVLNLGRAEAYSKSWTASAVRRFARDMGEHLDDILILASADVTSMHDKVHREVADKIKDLRKRITKYAEEDSKKNRLPKGIGNKIISELNIKPGKKVGEIKFKLEELIEADKLEAAQDIDFYIKYIEEYRDKFDMGHIKD
jgi:poly(A) polymerase